MMMPGTGIKAGAVHNRAFGNERYARFFTSLMFVKVMPSARSWV